MKNLIKAVNHKYLIVLLFVLYAASLFYSINSIVLRGEEPRRGAVSLEMVQSGNYITPTMHGEYYYNKPPVFNWLIAGASQLTGGINHAAVRLPSLLSLFLMGMVHFLFIRRYFGLKLAAFSTIILMTCAELLYHGTVHSGEIDLFYSLLVYLQAISMIHFYRSKHPLLLYLASYGLMAVGFLTKGLPSLHFQAFGLLSLFFIDRRFRYFLSWQHLSGLILGSGIIYLYFYIYSLQNDPLPYLLKQFTEAVGKSVDGKSFSGIISMIFMFPLILLKILLPWSVFILFFPAKKIKKLFREHTVFQFAVFFTITNIWIYWITPEVRLRYIYMFLPFLSVIIAVCMHHFFQVKKNWHKLAGQVTMVLLAVLSIGFLYPVFIEKHPFGLRFILPVLFFMGGAGIVLLYYKKPALRLYTFILMLVMARFFMNIYYYPAFQERFFKYGPFIQQAMEITQGKPILLAGDEYDIHLEAKLFGVQLSDKKSTISQPPDIPYQLPYYFGVNSQKIMTFHPHPKPNNFYISRKGFIKDKPVDVFLTTDHCITGCEGYALYKLK